MSFRSVVEELSAEFLEERLASAMGHDVDIPAIAAVTLAKKNVLYAVGIIENAWHETAQIEVMRGDEVLEKEPPLLRRAWALMPKILLDEFDVLVLDEIGKNISYRNRFA